MISATFNASKSLPTLIDSLRNQTDRDFEWVIADGASDDGTIDLLKSVTDIHVVISSQPDFGIYDALNRAVKNSKGDYYLVMGADDVLYPDSIASFRSIASNEQPDMVSARVKVDGKVCAIGDGRPSMCMQCGRCSSKKRRMISSSLPASLIHWRILSVALLKHLVWIGTIMSFRIARCSDLRICTGARAVLTRLIRSWGGRHPQKCGM